MRLKSTAMGFLVSAGLFQLENCWKYFDVIWCGYYAIGG
jgi:hypothetical protein